MWKSLFWGMMFLFARCSDKALPDNKLAANIPLQKGNTETIKDIRDLFTLVDKIELECTDACLITQIKRIFATDSFIIVLDEKDPLPMVFNRQGKFIRKIGRIGRGPGEIESNDWTDADDSMIMVLTFPNMVINQYTYDNRFVRDINLLSRNLFYTVFHYYNNSVYLNHLGLNQQNTILGRLSLQTNEFKPVWQAKSNEEEKAFGKRDFYFYRLLKAFDEGDVYLCLSNEYKIRHWKNDTYMGYYTNHDYAYRFFSHYEISRQEFNTPKYTAEYKKSDKIAGIYVLNHHYIMVDVFSIVGIPKQIVKADNQTFESYDFIGYIDLIDMKTKKIYSHIPQKMPNFSGTYKDQLVTWKQPYSETDDLEDIEELRNPIVQFYRLNEEKLE